jgi:ubiquinone/menaquinone biosynthesis C-methylase UbiE
MVSLIDRGVGRLMAVPQLYRAVQASVAGPLHRQVTAHLRAAIPDRPGIRVLDLGCGTGDYAVLFERAAYCGVDSDDRYVQAAAARVERANVTFAVGDATALEFPDASFDYCFSVGLHHHLPDDAVLRSLTDAVRVSAPGRVVVADAIFPPHGNWPGWVLRRLDRGKHVRRLDAYAALLRSRFPAVELRALRGGLLDYVLFRL